MKRLIFAVLAGVLLASSAVSARAEDKKEGREGGKQHEHMVKMMKEKLGLSDDQSKKLEALHNSNRETMKPLQEALKKAMDRVHGHLLLGSSDKEIAEALDQVDKAMDALHNAQRKMKSEADAIMTPTQRAKMMAFHEGMMHHGMMMEHGDGDGEHGGGWRHHEGKEEHEHGDKKGDEDGD